MIQLHNEINAHKNSYNAFIYFEQKYENMPLQILSFIDMLKINQY